jgi:hypothetical protein
MRIKKFNESNEVLYKHIDFDEVMELDEFVELSKKESNDILSLFDKDNIITYTVFSKSIEVYSEIKSYIGSFKSSVSAKIESLGDNWYLVSFDKGRGSHYWFKCDDIIGIKQLLTDQCII